MNERSAAAVMLGTGAKQAGFSRWGSFQIEFCDIFITMNKKPSDKRPKDIFYIDYDGNPLQFYG
jgi:hypothetical protein